MCRSELKLNFVLITLSSPPLGLPRLMPGGGRYKTKAGSCTHGSSSSDNKGNRDSNNENNKCNNNGCEQA